ncbi:MAG: sulfatase-like hydrolase/transferase [Planctomycetes bacterium]|nr:sulfatase-like hydrolase/transferase [Planctomycetota bacterium]
MPGKTKPNILFIFSDQQRWDTMGCYGQKLDVTPNLDRLAYEGVLFRNAFTCQPVCGPARACLQSGKYATEVGCFKNGIALPLGIPTLARHMRKAGYEAGYIGKWHLASVNFGPEDTLLNLRTEPVPPERRGGYDDYWLAADVLEFTSHGYDGYMYDADMKRVDFKGYRVDCVTDFVLDYLGTRTGEKPWFLFLSYIEPHHQNDHNRYEGPNGSREKWKDYEVPGDLVDTEGDWRENFPDYLGCCNSIDHNFGRIRDELEKLGVIDNTLLIYTSDHGSHFRTRNAEYKRACHDACTHVPLIINGPGFTGGKVVEELVSLIDLPPTVLAAGQAAPLPGMQGRPLQELTGNGTDDWPDEVFMQISESHVGRAVRTDRWKYSVRAPEREGGRHPDSNLYVEDYLYDLKDDPHERNNLVKDPAFDGVRADMRQRLMAFMARAHEAAPEIRPAG